ncbi:MAG: hypothetical protein CMH83_08575 [Nocardioides sp.]|nr:hypothetical protein [Nocardioides sp.]
MHETDVATLAATSTLPVVRHQLQHREGLRAWVSDDATAYVVQQRRPWDGGLALWLLGDTDALGPLAAAVAAQHGVPHRVLVEERAREAVPAPWRPVRSRTWHWMSTREAPPAPRHPVVDLGPDDDTEVSAFLDEAYPGTFARPGTDGVEGWSAVRDEKGILAVGCVVRQDDGTGYLRGVSVFPARAGEGLGGAVSARLTARAQAGASGLASLGVFVENGPALAVYRRLRYEVGHTFVAGVPAGAAEGA